MSPAVGVGAVLVGYVIGSAPTAEWLGRLAGVGAVTGNVFNPYYRFRGGKGLGISAGVLAALWPTVLVPVVAVLVITLLVLWPRTLAMLRARQGRLWQGRRTKPHPAVRRGRGHSQGRHWPSRTRQTFVVGALVTRSSGAAAIVATVAFSISAVLWAALIWPMAWGIAATNQLLVLSLGIGAVLWNRHWTDSPFSRQHRLSLREPA